MYIVGMGKEQTFYENWCMEDANGNKHPVYAMSGKAIILIAIIALLGIGCCLGFIIR